MDNSGASTSSDLMRKDHLYSELNEAKDCKLEPLSEGEDTASELSERPSERTLTASEPSIDEMEDMLLDVKPFILPDGTAVDNTSIYTDVEIKVEDIDSTIPFKEEVNGFDNFGFAELPKENTEEYLMANPDVCENFCGLSDAASFGALLDYISDDIKPVQGTTKYEQLLSVLTKLHRNIDNLYLNRYKFPSVYVLIVELLFEKLDVLCKDLSECEPLPAIFLPEFDRTQKVVIFGVMSINVKAETCVEPAENPEELLSVKYLVGYSAFGEVFFVSHAFIGPINNKNLISKCGVLEKLDKDHWILLNEDDAICVMQVENLLYKWDCKAMNQMNSYRVKRYTLQVINKILDKFKCLTAPVSHSMLEYENGTCFLDKVVFVCCMLLNMMPLCAYE